MTRLPLITALLMAMAWPVQAQRMDAKVECEPTENRYEYACLVALTAGDEPVEGADFTVKPDMPEMPMAHNIRPQPAEPIEEPGIYAVTLPLEMYGLWALRIEVSTPRRDVVVVHKDFQPEGDSDYDHGEPHQHHGHGGHGHDSEHDDEGHLGHRH
jgi:hypothetical protein